MEIFAYLGILVALYLFHITNSNHITETIDKELKGIQTFKREEKPFEKLLLFNKMEFLYDRLVLFSTLNLLITGLLSLSASAFKSDINCIPFGIIVIVIYIPSFVITYLTYLYYMKVRALNRL